MNNSKKREKETAKTLSNLHSLFQLKESIRNKENNSVTGNIIFNDLESKISLKQLELLYLIGNQITSVLN